MRLIWHVYCVYAKAAAQSEELWARNKVRRLPLLVLQTGDSPRDQPNSADPSEGQNADPQVTAREVRTAKRPAVDRMEVLLTGN